MKTITATVLALALALGTTPSLAAALEDPKVIAGVDAERLELTDGTVLRLAPQVSVKKKGYDLTVADLRPGWAVVPKDSDQDGRIDALLVAGIPVARTWPAYDGPRDTVAVARAELGFMPAVQALAGVDVQQALESLAASVLKATGRFLIVDLASRDEVLNEQDFAHTGYANSETAARGGRMAAAHYLVKVAVLDFDYATRTGDAGGAFGFSVGKNKSRSRLSLEVRFADVGTGMLEASAQVTKTFGADATQFRANLAETAGALAAFKGSSGLKDLEKLASAGITVAHNGFVQSSIGELFSLAVNEAIEKCVASLPSRGWQSVIVDVVDPRHVVIRGGDNERLKAGTELAVRQAGTPLTDPVTGEPLGAIERPRGHVRITEVHDKFSIAEVVFGGGFERGDLCLTDGGHR
jgi:curli biogenesis system outer membrane secretion channel CsgG